MDYSSEVSDPQAATPLARDVFKPRHQTHLKVIVGVSIVGMVAIGVVMGIMWQSNSFIAQNQDVRSDASTQETQGAQTVHVVQSAQLAAKDQRFGVGGDCDIAKTIGVPWMFNWGGGWTGLINEPEINCAQQSGNTMSTVLTVGHANSWDGTNSISDSRVDRRYHATLAAAEVGMDPEVASDYTKLKEVLAKHPSVFNSIKILASFLQIPQMAQQYPNAYWQIANEPDWSPYFRPEEYADYYYAFYRQIKRHDPSAKIGIGGLAFAKYDHIKKGMTGYVDWSLWKNVPRSEYGGGLITSFSTMTPANGGEPIRHVTKGGQVLRYDIPTNQWINETTAFDNVGVRDETIKSFYQIIDNGVHKKWLVRGGKLYAYQSNNTWLEATSLITTPAPYQGQIMSFSMAFDARNKRVQYVVRCATTCSDHQLFYRNEKEGGGWDNNPSAWNDELSANENNFSLVGKGNFNFFVNKIVGNNRAHYLIRGGKLWHRSGDNYTFKNELVSDPYITELIAGNQSKAALYKNGAWFLLFLKHYREKYNVGNPPLDFINIHPYPWTAHNTEGSNPGYSDDASIAAAVNDTKESVQHTHNLMQDSEANLPNTPIIITEFSLAGDEKDKDCTTIADCESQARFADTYIRGVVPWLKQSNLVHKWLWFYAGPPGNTATSGNSNLNTLGTQLMYIKNISTNELNVTANAYRNELNKVTDRDQVIPQLTKIENLAVSGNTSLRELKMTVTESQPSAAYEYWYCIGKSAGACDLRNWRSRLTRSKTQSLYPPVTVSGYSGTVYATVKVTDSTGNTSQVVSGPITTLSL